MGWELSINGDAEALRWLVRNTAESSLRVTVVQSTHRLEWDALEAMDHSDQNQVEVEALKHLFALSGFASAMIGRYGGLQLVDVAFRTAKGNRIVEIFIHDTMLVSSTVESDQGVLDSAVTSMRGPHADLAVRVLAMAATDQIVAKVLRLSNDDLADWPGLFRLYEVLKDAVGGSNELAMLAGVSHAQLKTFTSTANSPELSGDGCRHGVQTGSVPSKAMALSDAVQLVRHLVQAWLMARASG